MAKIAYPIAAGPRLRDQVYNFIKEEIRNGSYEPGYRFVEVAVAEQLGISRTPVREALFQLARDGLLVEAERGFKLPMPSVEDSRYRMELRRLLEPTILRHACERASDRQIKAFVKEVKAERACIHNENPMDFIRANSRVRATLLSLTPNHLLQQAAQLYDDQFQMFRVEGLKVERNRKITSDFHEKLAEAIQNRNVEEAQAVLFQMVDWLESLLV